MKIESLTRALGSISVGLALAGCLSKPLPPVHNVETKTDSLCMEYIEKVHKVGRNFQKIIEKEGTWLPLTTYYKLDKRLTEESADCVLEEVNFTRGVNYRTSYSFERGKGYSITVRMKEEGYHNNQ